MIEGLVNVLNGMQGIPFTEVSWSSAPGDRYGVVTLSGKAALSANMDPAAENMPEGYVDVYVLPKHMNPTKSIETALRTLGLWFKLESVQYEPETGLLHFEWSWRDGVGLACQEVYAIRFENEYLGPTFYQIVKHGEYPTPETPESYDEGGIIHDFDRWDPNLERAYENTTYEARYCIKVAIIDGFAYNGKTGDPFTQEQIEAIVQWFDEGDAVYATEEGIAYAADEVGEQEIEYNGTRAQWAVI